ncbi:serine/threonine protein kinase [Deinococcus metallilatus]|uniref:Serine/threonine protein kinase n=1 Tax=Deinococcus metallilatus TaxID=1211322 RepID=A0AAJ5F0I8_9DEIO|nr:serine/threonine-protein kinase [Deinococcus metallilatus]QBY08529.1 serine/threonine protein kinase [Deinococcus metallilatus]RXJ11039.1 serine/threonine protein kinase [Deinococcus metallilatus]TLK21583.1 serine/threonine protein kinase [Deinococcus metallilatus]GMA15092.1 serine/threonine protein kinase [Deinococcus metallilatus]
MDCVQQVPDSQLTEARSLEPPRVLAVRGGIQSEVGEWRGREVFVKTLLTDDPQAALRFEHEGQIAAGLDHPLVVPLLAQTRAQLIFPFVPGPTLRERVEHGPLSPAEALGVTCGVLGAVTHLHARGVTHHDLKPENVLLAGGSLRGECVRLVDFGMSHSQALPHDIHGGTRMGTPHFMAPEQFQGVRGDPRSDLYSVGVLLFDCLAGHPPYEDALGWLVGLCDDCAPLPGPPELHPVLQAALSRDPAERPGSAAEMRAALRGAARALGLEAACP